MENSYHPLIHDNFVGRKEELKRLRKSRGQTFAGAGVCLLISGEAGIGKSSLVRHFTREAVEKGALYVSGKFEHTHSFDPYGPFIKIIQKLSASTFDFISLSQALSEGRSQIDKFRNEEFLREIQNERNILQQKIVSALNAVAKDNPLVIEFTDVHSAPLTSWQFIHYLAHSVVDQKIMIILTLRQDGRQTQSDKIPVYADVLQRMNREGLLEIIRLERFSRNEIREYVNHVFPRRDFSSKLIPLVHEVSQGLPDQLSKVIRLMLYLGLVYQQENIWFNDENLDRENLTYFLSEEYEKKEAETLIKELSAEQTRILQYASLFPSSIDHHLLSEILKLARFKLVKELSFFKEQNILIEKEDGNFSFKRGAFRLLFYESIPFSRRIKMYGEILRVLEKFAKTSEEAYIPLLAYHSSQLGSNRKSFKYLLKAGEYAIRRLGFLEAKEFFEKAIKLIPMVSKNISKKKLQNFLLEAAWLDRVLGYWLDSLNKCKMLRQFCNIADIKLRNQILIQEGLTYFRLNDWKNSSDCFHKILLTPKDISLNDRAMATYGLGNIFFETSQYEEAKNYYHQAAGIAEELNSLFLKANIFNNLGAIESIRGNRLKAIALYSQAIPLFKELNDNYGLARLYNNIGMTYAEEKNWLKANEFYGKSLGISDVYGLIHMKSITFLNRALALVHLKKYEEAREYNFKAFRILTRLQEDLGLAEYHKIQGIIEKEEGSWHEAEKNLQIALEKFRQLKNKLGCAETQYELAILHRANAEHDEMKNWMQKALQTYGELGIKDKVKLIESQLEELQFSDPLVVESIK